MEKIFTKALPPLQELFLSQAIVHRFDINCKMLAPYGEFDFGKRQDGYLGNMFTTLDKINSPCLYWFEASDIEAAKRIKDALEVYRNNPERNGRTIPAANKNLESKVIYVGKRYGGITKKTKLSHIGGRMYIHLGYYSKAGTQGLQLVHWSKEDLTLFVLELPVAAKPYMAILENLLAIELTPLCGRHGR